MDKMDYPKGLIRYSSGNGIVQRLSAAQIIKRISRPRVWIYCSLLLLVCSVFTFSLMERKSFSVDVIKDRGSLAREVGRGEIENVYRLQIMNSLEQPQRFTVSVSGLPDLRISSDVQLAVAAVGIGTLPVRLTLPPEVAAHHRGETLPVAIEVQASSGNGQQIKREKTTFYVLP
jgi:polyferredoxin